MASIVWLSCLLVRAATGAEDVSRDRESNPKAAQEGRSTGRRSRRGEVGRVPELSSVVVPVVLSDHRLMIRNSDLLVAHHMATFLLALSFLPSVDNTHRLLEIAVLHVMKKERVDAVSTPTWHAEVQRIMSMYALEVCCNIFGSSWRGEKPKTVQRYWSVISSV